MLWSKELYKIEEKFYYDLQNFQAKHLRTGRKFKEICAIANLNDSISNNCMTGPDLTEYIPKSEIMQHLYNDIQRVNSLIYRIQKDIDKYNIPLTYDGMSSEYVTFKHEHIFAMQDLSSYKSLKISQYMNVDCPDGKSYEIDDFSTLRHFINYLIDLSNELQVQYDIILKGEQGEQAVGKYLSMLEYKYTIMQNVILPADGLGSETAETDAYIITDKGVFVCEVKNWGNSNSIIQVNNGGQWLKLSLSGKILETLKSPIEQNTKHCIATDRFLRAHGINNAKIIPMVIMANDGAIIDNQSSNIVLKISDVYNFVEGYNGPSALDNDTQERIAKLFSESTDNISERKFPIISYSLYADRFEQVYNKLRDITMEKQQELVNISNLYHNNVYIPLNDTNYQFEIGIKSFGLSIVLTLILTLLLSNIFKGLMVIIAPVICYYIFKYIRCEIADDTQSTMLFKRWMYIVNNHVTLEEYYQ